MNTAAGTVGEASSLAQTLVENVERVIVGKATVVRQAVTALLADGHLLLEDIPGIGKTMLARALARSIAGDFKRIQFTADLLPSDVTGVNIFRQREGDFAFRAGPVFCHVLLADEINRATPRTQSSLLEAMEEHQVTVDGVMHPLPRPFLVVATQNPIELEGTYPLPFAQLDRFLVRLRLGYLEAAQEREMLAARIRHAPIDTLQPVLDGDALVGLQQRVRALTVAPALLDYIVAVVRATRETEQFEYGASPRAALDLVRYSQASALLAGRDYVLPDDVKAAVPPLLTHRVIVRRGTRHGTLNTDEYLRELVETVPVPV